MICYKMLQFAAHPALLKWDKFLSSYGKAADSHLYRAFGGG